MSTSSNPTPNYLRNELGQKMGPGPRRAEVREMFDPERIKQDQVNLMKSQIRMDTASRTISESDISKEIKKEVKDLEIIKKKGFSALKAYALRKDLPIDIINDIEQKDQSSVFKRYNSIDFLVKNFNNGQMFDNQMSLLESLIKWQMVQNALSSGKCNNSQYALDGIRPLDSRLKGYTKNPVDGSIRLYPDLETQCNETDVYGPGVPPGTKYKWSIPDIGKDEVYLRREIGAFPFYSGPIPNDRRGASDELLSHECWKTISRNLRLKSEIIDSQLRSQTNGLDILTYFNLNENDITTIQAEIQKK